MSKITLQAAATRAAEIAVDRPTFREQLVARLARCYPFLSGCGSLAGSGAMRALAPERGDLVWARAHGADLCVPLDDYVGRAIYFFGDMDRKLSRICRRVVRPGDTVLDVGANLGVVTLLLSRLVGPTGHVHAFEPNPRLVRMLKADLDCAGAENVVLHPIALGAADGELELAAPAGNAGAGSLVRTGEHLERTRVPVVRLARVLAVEKCGPIRLVKIDVEGFEPQVFAGAQAWFERRPPDVIVFELNEADATGDHPTFGALAALGYRFLSIPRALVRLQLRPWSLGQPLPVSYDFVAVHQDAADLPAGLGL